MRPVAAAVVQNLGVVTLSIFEGISQDRQAIEVTILVDRMRQGYDIRRQPARINPHGAERVAEDVVEESDLNERLSLFNGFSIGVTYGATEYH